MQWTMRCYRACSSAKHAVHPVFKGWRCRLLHRSASSSALYTPSFVGSLSTSWMTCWLENLPLVLVTVAGMTGHIMILKGPTDGGSVRFTFRRLYKVIFRLVEAMIPQDTPMDELKWPGFPYKHSRDAHCRLEWSVPSLPPPHPFISFLLRLLRTTRHGPIPNHLCACIAVRHLRSRSASRSRWRRCGWIRSAHRQKIYMGQYCEPTTTLYSGRPR